MSKLRIWLIKKLGGTVINVDRCKGTTPDEYWTWVPIVETIYVSQENYKKNFQPAIEHELANKIAFELIQLGCVGFMEPVKDHEDIRITATCSALKLSKREPYHIKDRLQF